MIWWSRHRCGKGEEVHGVVRMTWPGGQASVGLFGFQRSMVGDGGAGLHLNSTMKRLVLGEQWVSRRLKAVRFALIALPGRVVSHARRADNPPGPWPSLIRVAAQGTAEDIRDSCRAVPGISRVLRRAAVEGDLSRVARPGHAFFGLTTATIGVRTLNIPT